MMTCLRFDLSIMFVFVMGFNLPITCLPAGRIICKEKFYLRTLFVFIYQWFISEKRLEGAVSISILIPLTFLFKG